MRFLTPIFVSLALSSHIAFADAFSNSRAPLTEAQTFTVDQLKNASTLVATSTIVISGVTFYLTSNAGPLPTAYTAAVSTALTLLFNGKVPGLEDFPAMFSKYINWAGDISDRELAKTPGLKADALKRARIEIGRVAAIVGPALFNTSLFILAANSGNLDKTFLSGAAVLFILNQTVAGLSTNAPWDVFEAEVRKQPGDADENERLARLSLYTRQLFGSAVGPFFFLPHGQIPTTIVFAAHGIIGGLAVAFKTPAIKVLSNFMKSLERSPAFAQAVQVYGKVKSPLVGCRNLLRGAGAQ